MPAGAEGFQPGRLTMAREARAMKQRELAAKVDRSESAVSAWENTSKPHRPEPAAVALIAAAVDVSPNWFFRPLSGDSQAVFYRSLLSELVVLRDRARARLGFVEAIEQTLSEYVEMPTIDIPDISKEYNFLDLRKDDIESISSEVRVHWGLGDGPLEDVLLLVENAGVIVGEDDIGSLKLDGVSWWSGRSDRPYVLLAKDKRAGVRRRFDAAHELAHLILHRHVSPEELVANFALIEEQAMALAGSLLMPASTFLPDVYSLSLDALLSLKEKWGVSVGAMIKRLANAGEISDHYERRLWQYYSQRRWRGREPLDDSIPVEVPMFLRDSVEMLVADGYLTKSGLVAEIGLSPNDILVLCGLEEGYFASSLDKSRIRPVLKDEIGQSPNVVPFPRRSG